MLIEPLSTERLTLRCLLPVDDLASYLQWMRNVGAFPFIESVKVDYTTKDLVEYLNEINSSRSTIQLSIFENKQNRHIGNLKFHDINLDSGTCFVGFLIGDKESQNKGVAKEAFIHSSAALYKLFGISQYKLGVSSIHTQAINAYRKMGFVPCVSYNNPERSKDLMLMAKIINPRDF